MIREGMAIASHRLDTGQRVMSELWLMMLGHRTTLPRLTRRYESKLVFGKGQQARISELELGLVGERSTIQVEGGC